MKGKDNYPKHFSSLFSHKKFKSYFTFISRQQLFTIQTKNLQQNHLSNTHKMFHAEKRNSARIISTKNIFPCLAHMENLQQRPVTS